MLDQSGDLADLDTISFESKSQLNVLNESIEVVTLEIRCEFVHERSHIRKVDQAVVHAKLHLEEVQDECIRIGVCVVHVGLNSLSEVIARDILRAVQSSLHTKIERDL